MVCVDMNVTQNNFANKINANYGSSCTKLPWLTRTRFLIKIELVA